MTTEKQSAGSVIQGMLEKFREDYKARPFTARHPELGKMINCPVCQTRHRSSLGCKAVYVADVPHTKAGLYGAKSFKGRRQHPHHNQKNLQLLERTRLLFPYYNSYLEPLEAMKAARAEAKRDLRGEQKQRSDRVRRQQELSRRINRGLEFPGTQLEA